MSKPLSNTELLAAAPSNFSEAAIETASEQYHFLATHTVLDTFRQAGYFPIMAGESAARDKSNQPHVRHIIQFRSLSNILRPSSKEEYADITMSNSSNLWSSLTLNLNYFRIACSNLLVISSEQFMFHHIVHKGMQTFKIDRALSAFGLSGSEYASANEVTNAVNQQQNQQQVQQLPQNNSQQQYQQAQGQDENEVQQLNALGLSLEYHGDEVIVTGSSYGHQALLKQFKYRFDPNRKCCWKQNTQQQEA